MPACVSPNVPLLGTAARRVSSRYLPPLVLLYLPLACRRRQTAPNSVTGLEMDENTKKSGTSCVGPCLSDVARVPFQFGLCSIPQGGMTTAYMYKTAKMSLQRSMAAYEVFAAVNFANALRPVLAVLRFLRAPIELRGRERQEIRRRGRERFPTLPLSFGEYPSICAPHHCS
jgi:hypothetical protein